MEGFGELAPWLRAEGRGRLGSYLWALRPDSVVPCMDHEAFNHPTEVECRPAAIYEALTQGATAFPELRELLAAGPSESDSTKAS